MHTLIYAVYIFLSINGFLLLLVAMIGSKNLIDEDLIYGWNNQGLEIDWFKKEEATHME